jgi:hypothetical protein
MMLSRLAAALGAKFVGCCAGGIVKAGVSPKFAVEMLSGICGSGATVCCHWALGFVSEGIVL